MRLNNFISSSGICSRRQADELIKKNKVTVNGDIPSIGYTVKSDDIVKVNGHLIESKQNNIYIALNKPKGITCTTEKHITGNIIDFVNYPERIFPIGRLDKDSEGLILLTNDGSIVNKILREENGLQKEYIVTVDKTITPSFLKGLSTGVEIYNPVKNEYTITRDCIVEKINDRTFRIILSQGLNRQIRRMCSVFEYKIVNLKRIRIANIRLEDLPVGKWRYLTKDEIRVHRTEY